MEMNNYSWKLFVTTCRQQLGIGDWDAYNSASWCAFTTFSSLSRNSKYWNCGFPETNELSEIGVADGGLWREPISYMDLAHIVVPATFWWDRTGKTGYEWGQKFQDIEKLSNALTELSIPHRKSALVLEVKCY